MPISSLSALLGGNVLEMMKKPKKGIFRREKIVLLKIALLATKIAFIFIYKIFV